MQHIVDTLTTGLQKYCTEYCFQKAVVGISGGVDSAVTAAIATRALGNEKVCGILMPYTEFSSAENLNDARELTQILGIQKEEIVIDPFVESFLGLAWVNQPLTKANILARVRMMILYSWANEHGALVLGTCNKSEILLGYETKFGDGACDISVLGALWKTQVWALAKFLELPEQLVTKSPSAELFAGHTDEEELGFGYHFADEVLQQWERGEELNESDERVQEILRRIQMHEHKRRLAPTVEVR